MSDVRKVLMARLEECCIEDFTLDAKKKTLEIGNKQDFDLYLTKFNNPNPRILSSRQNMSGDLPYGATHWASFLYDNWEVRGNVVVEKSS